MDPNLRHFPVLAGIDFTSRPTARKPVTVALGRLEQGVVRYNTIVNPETWVFRILQENNEPGMVPCSKGVFEKNIIVCEKNPVRAWMNIGGNAQAGTFKFADNWWYHKAASQPAKPALPSAEQGGTYGVDPQLEVGNNYKPKLAGAMKVGQGALPK